MLEYWTDISLQDTSNSTMKLRFFFVVVWTVHFQ